MEIPFYDVDLNMLDEISNELQLRLINRSLFKILLQFFVTLSLALILL